MRRGFVFLGMLWILIAAAGPGVAQLETVWTATYGGTANDGLLSAIETADGHLIAVGYSYSFGPGEVNLYVVKTDAGGDTLWTRALGGAGRDYGYGVCEATGGGCVVAGYTTSSGAGREDVYVARLDADGDVVWERAYGGLGSDEGRAVCASSDGCFVVAGRTDSFGSGESDVYVLKLDADGDSLWTLALGGSLYDWGEDVCESADGCYCVCGSTGSSSSSRDILLAKITAAGTPVWERSYGDAVVYIGHDWGTALCATADSGLAVTGSRVIAGVDPDEIYFLKADQLGNQTSLKRYYGTFIEYGCSICETPEGGFLICGAEKDEYTLKNDLMLVKRVPGSNWVWEQVVGGAGSDWGSSAVDMAAPGYYLIAGHTESYGAGGYDGWLLKMREPLAYVPDQVVGGPILLGRPSPNPFSGETTLRFSVSAAASGAPSEVAVYDVAGRMIRSLGQCAAGAAEQSVAWDGTDRLGRPVGPGIYLLRVTAGGTSASRKVVKTSATSAAGQ
jgi:hypothetical protein